MPHWHISQIDRRHRERDEEMRQFIASKSTKLKIISKFIVDCGRLSCLTLQKSIDTWLNWSRTIFVQPRLSEETRTKEKQINNLRDFVVLSFRLDCLPCNEIYFRKWQKWNSHLLLTFNYGFSYAIVYTSENHQQKPILRLKDNRKIYIKEDDEVEDENDEE